MSSRKLILEFGTALFSYFYFRKLKRTMVEVFQAIGMLAVSASQPVAAPNDVHFAFKLLGLLVVMSPVLLFVGLGCASLLRDQVVSEKVIVHSVQTAIVTGLIASVAMLVLMQIWDDTQVPIEFGSWVHVENPDTMSDHYHFVFKFEFDRLSVPFVIFTYSLCGVIGAFANRYLHRERGFNRFFILLSLFVVGMVTTSLAGTVETLFTGWELVGLSSALLVAFFHERPAPASNGLHVWVIYRFSDAALLMAAVALHHMKGEGDFDLFLTGQWPGGTVLDPNQAFFVGLLLLIAAMGKSAMIPFSGWLPRAMEGPTPSSAVFYGALSVHLGAFLLLRFSPILDQSLTLRILIVTVGIGTALFATFAGAVQTDIKSALSFASLSQVGLIFAEIGMGFRYIPLIHILGHGCLRTLQFLRAPTLLYDYRTMEDAIGERLPKFSAIWLSRMPPSMRIWCYRLALERGYLDSLMKEYLTTPFLGALRKCNDLERRWISMLSGYRKSPTSEASQTFEELL